MRLVPNKHMKWGIISELFQLNSAEFVFDWNATLCQQYAHIISQSTKHRDWTALIAERPTTTLTPSKSTLSITWAYLAWLMRTSGKEEEWMLTQTWQTSFASWLKDDYRDTERARRSPDNGKLYWLLVIVLLLPLSENHGLVCDWLNDSPFWSSGPCRKGRFPLLITHRR